MISSKRIATLATSLLLAICALAPSWAQETHHPLSIAHRGNSLFAPENTLAAFRAAGGHADMVEFDVRVSADGELVLLHNDTLEHTAHVASPVTAETFASLREMEVGSWFAPEFEGEPIATLEEALETILPDMIPLIERKRGDAAAYVELLQRMGVEHDVVLQSFNWEFLANVHALDPTIRLGALGSEDLTASDLASIELTGAEVVAWNYGQITEAEVAMVHERGMELYVWTVDGGLIPRMLDLGVDGLITNDPAMVTTLRDGGEVDGDSLVAGMVNHWRWDEISDDPLDLDLGTNAVTISAWINLDALPSEIEGDFVGIFDSREDGFVLYLDREAEQLRFKITDTEGHAARPGIPEDALEVGSWHRIVGVYDGSAGPVTGQALIYLDGRLMDAHTGPDGEENQRWGLTSPVIEQVATIGQSGFHVRDVSIWNRALSPIEVETLCNPPEPL